VRGSAGIAASRLPAGPTIALAHRTSATIAGATGNRHSSPRAGSPQGNPMVGALARLACQRAVLFYRQGKPGYPNCRSGTPPARLSHRLQRCAMPAANLASTGSLQSVGAVRFRRNEKRGRHVFRRDVEDSPPSQGRKTFSGLGCRGGAPGARAKECQAEGSSHPCFMVGARSAGSLPGGDRLFSVARRPVDPKGRPRRLEIPCLQASGGL